MPASYRNRMMHLVEVQRGLIEMSLHLLDQKMIWCYKRDENPLIHLEQVTEKYKGKGIVMLIDLRFIRYLLPEDRKQICQMIDALKNLILLIDLIYLVDFRNYHRMRMLIGINQLPYAHMVFKYEADANDYLSEVLLKQKYKDQHSII